MKTHRDVINMSKMEKSFEFVTRYYRPGAFRPTTVFVKIRHWRPITVAASIAGVVLVAAAMVYTLTMQPSQAPETPTTVVEPTQQSYIEQAPESVVKRIEFTDEPLAVVVQAIEETYGVKVSGLEADDDTRLTLSYEGNAIDLVETINDLTGKDLSVTPLTRSEKP